MKHLLLTTIAAVVLVGCGPSVDIWTAAEQGDIKAVKQHLDAGTDVNAKDKYGRTPLDEAAGEGHKEVVELLIAEGADVNAMDDDGDTPLDRVMPFGINKTETADLLRKHGGKTGAELSIHKAAEAGNIEAVKQHLAAGANVNAKDEDSKTPLLHAAVDGHKDVVELLIAKGADIELRCTTCGGTALGHAASGGHKEIIELLIEKGADVNAKSKGETTPLHSAAMHDHKEIAELLIAKGADVNVKDENSHTPLDLAIIYKSSRNRMLAQLAHSEIADLLRKHGAKHGTIYGAAAGGDIEAVKVFLANDMDVNARPKYGDSSLDHAIRGGSAELVNLLTKHGGKTRNELNAEGK
jgi:ankyrin repeat protein